MIIGRNLDLNVLSNSTVVADETFLHLKIRSWTSISLGFRCSSIQLGCITNWKKRFLLKRVKRTKWPPFPFSEENPVSKRK